MPGSQAVPDLRASWGSTAGARAIATLFDELGFDVDHVKTKDDGRVVVGFDSRHALEMRLRELSAR